MLMKPIPGEVLTAALGLIFLWTSPMSSAVIPVLFYGRLIQDMMSGLILVK